MTRLRLYDTLSRSILPLVPAHPEEFRLYCCGPTVYDVPHVGHVRSALLPDLLVRRLRAHGLTVKYVRNLTDVDDKILARAKQRGETPPELSSKMAQVYQDTLRQLNLLTPEVEPKVSEHIPQVIALIERLLAEEAAYVQPMPGGTTDVYFAVRSFAGYGKLSRRRLDELRAGARVEKDDTKRDPLDFALWKGAPEGEWGWQSPWGWGRPGWHIECSAMSHAHLGHGFDLHTGGMDLIFPHHENEIAQSEGAFGGTFVQRWAHNGFVNVDAEKMSKSLGNFVTAADVLARNDAEGFRWFLLTVHYRGPLQFDTETLPDGRVIFPGVCEAERRTDYLYAALERLTALAESAGDAPGRTAPELAALEDQRAQAERAAEAALDDDLNTPVALAALGELARLGNELCDWADKRRRQPELLGAARPLAQALLGSLTRVGGWLGLGHTPAPTYRARTRARRLAVRQLAEADVEARLAARAQARAAKDFQRSDALRDELAALGVVVKDTPEGQRWALEV